MLAARAVSGGFLEGTTNDTARQEQSKGFVRYKGKIRGDVPGFFFFFYIPFYVKSFLTSPALEQHPQGGKCDAKKQSLRFDKQYTHLGRKEM